ncbi:secreted lipase-like protein 3 [Paraphaeosphaeria sporulosa]
MAFHSYRDVSARREVLYVGGEYTTNIDGTPAQYMTGQIYVEKLTPSTESSKCPIVFIAGAGQTGTNWLHTPDGRPGWAHFFLGHGYTVYLTDQPSRGRSARHPSIGKMRALSTSVVESSFTAISSHNNWPQSKLHTQWPGIGKVGDPVFDAFYASQVPMRVDKLAAENENAKAYSALLDRIGEAYLITHSQAGPYGWRIGDARPQLVKGIVALEPRGPPCETNYPFPGQRIAFGIADGELEYDPPAGPNGEHLKTVKVPAKSANHDECTLQADPPKKLKNLSSIPVLVVTSEASFHALFDYNTVLYLEQAGVNVEHADLPAEGIRGNGHMFFMELNNMVIAERILTWLTKH